MYPFAIKQSDADAHDGTIDEPKPELLKCELLPTTKIYARKSTEIPINLYAQNGMINFSPLSHTRAHIYSLTLCDI